MCSRCKRRKADKHFSKQYSAISWASRQCKECKHTLNAQRWHEHGKADYQRSWRKRNPKKCKEYQQAQYAKHREKRLAEARAYRALHPALIKAQQKAQRTKLKKEVIAAYGAKCSCCGETELVFLTIEHIYHDGKAHRMAVGAGAGMYRDLRRRGFPKNGYTVFCWNCQMATRFGEPCPHKKIL